MGYRACLAVYLFPRRARYSNSIDSISHQELRLIRSDGMTGHKPTPQLRLLRIRIGSNVGMRHPAAFVPYSLSPVTYVLQQKWISDIVGEPDQWRDIPIEDATTDEE